MKYKIYLSIFFICITVHAQQHTINLVSEKKSNFKIVLSDSASHWDSIAAKEFQLYINEISGVQIPIIDDSSQITNEEIIIGINNHSKQLDIDSILTDDGFIIKTEEDKIYFAGGKRKGILNAVYSFLEKYLNCRMFSSKVKIIPKQESILLPQINDVENPAFSYRDIHYYESRNDEYCRWHKLVDSDDKKIWGMFVHTFQDLLPPEEYFREHPDYFALRNEVRVKDQPCLSNPDVSKIMIEGLRERMKENPAARIWSVSQNDNYSCCQCSTCRKLDEVEGSQSASVLNFVNKVAKEFPDKTISTLAYQYTRKPPRTIKPEVNVNIMLCSIESFRTEPLVEDTSADSFIHDLVEWSKLTKNIIVWDYVVQFTNLVSPFPNFHVIQPNIQTFAKFGVPMVFEQGAGNREGTEFNELRTYLIAKLLWNPFVNIDSVMNDFLNNYYGQAGKLIRTYIDLMTIELIKSKAKLWIYGSPILSLKDYLTPNLIKEYNHIFNEAEYLVKDNIEYFERVKAARLPLKYAMLQQAKVIGEGETGIIIKDEKGNYKTNPDLITLLEEFSYGFKTIGNVYIHEKQLGIDTYVSNYKSLLSKTMKNSLGLFKPVKYLTEPSWKYPANGEKTLTDGLRGDEDYHFNWHGFEGEDMEVILDLQESKIVKKVSTDFLQVILSWIFLPTQIEVSISEDGNNFKSISIVKNAESLEKDGTFIHTFSAEFEPVQTRYIKVKADNIEICPDWHIGHPLKAWIFIDEIVVE
jgi:hypothetical protein